ncbi:NnrS family protein [Paucibacter sp. R3-3]|uniref:NnrS family protein n=1 Tax=Roseateles agri TaxID=3098619 RepID=A0ABU5DRV2_9BURK|nr:NnrS family protein [Paucibacter sp. R3-3]MDY0749048.1 NnrS family protein [Paucibacter sp. R3-3]
MKKPGPHSQSASQAVLRGRPFLSLGFRPFYLACALAAVLLIGLWPWVFEGRLVPRTGLAPVLWHAHEMLFGMLAAAIVGFLLTAGRNWTGLPPPAGGQLAFLALLWLAGRLAAVLLPYSWFFVLDIMFLPWTAALFADLLWRARSQRNAGIAAVLGLLACANLGFHLAQRGVISVDPRRMLHAGLTLIVMMETMIGGRVIPLFTGNATGARIQLPPGLDAGVVTATALGLSLWLLGEPAAGLAAGLLILAALLQAWRLWLWQPWAARRLPMLWVLHVAYAWIPLGLALLAWDTAAGTPASPALHALTVGASGGLVMAIMTRTARGHTGRPLVAGHSDVLAYSLVLLAAVLRVGTPLLLPARFYAGGLVTAGLLWAAAFCVFLFTYSKWLMAPRADGRND